jgi:alpha-glucoside transport system ATP-binding protein
MNLLSGKVTGTGVQTTIQLDGGGTAVSHVATTDADMGLEVNVGVRPEDFVTATDSYIYENKVDITEALGEVTLLYFVAESSGEGVIAKLPGVHKELRGETVRMTAAPEKVHLFHQGKSLLYR